jgi:PAS domain S-box-containing protein
MPDHVENMESRPSALELVGSSLAEQPFFGVYLLQDGRFLYVNERLAQILGYPSVEEVLQLPSVLDTVYEDDRAMVRENMRTRLDGEVDQIRYSLRGRKKDGSPVDLEVQGRRVLHDGRPAIVGFQCDISERAREQRTYHARQKTEALGALAAGVAHDFNNILAAIATIAELITLEAKGQIRDDAAEIKEAVQRGARLCQRLMSFASEERGREPSASTGEVLAALIPILERLLGRRKVRLNLRVADDLPPVRLSTAELEQLVMNLVVNAGDASTEGGRVEILAAMDESANGQRVLLQVRDQGTGIAREHLDRLFEPYFTTKGDMGNGLGLLNVWQIVTGSAGDVKVDSEVGLGSTFSVFLPVERRQDTRDGAPSVAVLDHAWARRTGDGSQPRALDRDVSEEASGGAA